MCCVFLSVKCNLVICGVLSSAFDTQIRNMPVGAYCQMRKGLLAIQVYTVKSVTGLLWYTAKTEFDSQMQNRLVVGYVPSNVSLTVREKVLLTFHTHYVFILYVYLCACVWTYPYMYTYKYVCT